MSDRDWEKELAKIDKQLGSLSDEPLLGPAPVQLPGTKGTPPAKAAKAAKPGKALAAPAAPMVPGEPTPTKAWAVYARLTISVALGIAMILWPYPARCGPGLA